MAVMIQENALFYEKLTSSFGDLTEFEAQIRQITDIVGIDLTEFEIDHLAVRMNTIEKAQAWRDLLLSEKSDKLPFPSASLLKESLVNGRPIALIHLHTPLTFCNQQVSIIELPFPKNKTYPVEGWEHIELVVPMLENESVAEWIDRLHKRWNLTENLQIKRKISEPKVEGERLPNPSIAISLADKNLNNHCSIKLHPYSIQNICQKS